MKLQEDKRFDLGSIKEGHYNLHLLLLSPLVPRTRVFGSVFGRVFGGYLDVCLGCV